MSENATDDAVSGAVVDPGRRTRSRAPLIRAVVFLVVAAVAVVVAVPLAAHGIRVDTFPPYVAGDTETKIRQFSGPWITGAFGLIALAGLLVVAAVADLRAPAPVAEEPAVAAGADRANSVPAGARPDGPFGRDTEVQTP